MSYKDNKRKWNRSDDYSKNKKQANYSFSRSSDKLFTEIKDTIEGIKVLAPGMGILHFNEVMDSIKSMVLKDYGRELFNEIEFSKESEYARSETLPNAEAERLIGSKRPVEVREEEPAKRTTSSSRSSRSNVDIEEAEIVREIITVADWDTKKKTLEHSFAVNKSKYNDNLGKVMEKVVVTFISKLFFDNMKNHANFKTYTKCKSLLDFWKMFNKSARKARGWTPESEQNDIIDLMTSETDHAQVRYVGGPQSLLNKVTEYLALLKKMQLQDYKFDYDDTGMTDAQVQLAFSKEEIRINKKLDANRKILDTVYKEIKEHGSDATMKTNLNIFESACVTRTKRDEAPFTSVDTMITYLSSQISMMHNSGPEKKQLHHISRNNNGNEMRINNQQVQGHAEKKPCHFCSDKPPNGLGSTRVKHSWYDCNYNAKSKNFNVANKFGIGNARLENAKKYIQRLMDREKQDVPKSKGASKGDPKQNVRINAMIEKKIAEGIAKALEDRENKKAGRHLLSRLYTNPEDSD